MALVVADRVKEATSTTGTGDVSLSGAPANFVSFGSALSNGDTTYYAIVDNTNSDYEVGIGTYTSATDSLSRDTIFESSNSGAKVDLQTGQKDVFITYPASKSLLLDASGEVLGDQTFSGSVTLNADPTSGLQAATKQYVDTIAAAGLHYHDPVRVEKEGNLAATYNNGTAGVGATLTNSGTQEALVIDGVTLSVNDRVLIYEQTDATQNGIYDVTDTGSASTNWVLTRSSDADSYGPSDPDSLGQGDAFFVQEGALGAGETYVMNTEGTITFGTTNITFVQISSAQIYTGGTGISISGSEISSDITLAEVTANGATTTANVTFGNITGNTLVSNSITYPTADGSPGAFIKTDGSGNLSFATALTATPTLDAVTTAGNNTANSITVGNINASDVSCNALTSNGIDDNATSTAITIDSSQNVSLSGDLTVDTNTLYVDSTNNRVGINRTPTTFNVEFDGSAQLIHDRAGANTAQVVVGSGGTSNVIIDGDTIQLRDEGGVTQITKDVNGNVTIDGSDASTSLASTAILNLKAGDANNEYSILRFATSADGSIAYIGAKATTTGAYPSSVGNLEFGVQNGASTVTAMTLDSSGNVGIGTTSPTGFAGYTSLDINNATSGALIDLSQGDAMKGRLIATASTMAIETASSVPIIFQPAGTERMRLDASGRVGINTSSPDSNIVSGIDNQSFVVARYDLSGGVPSGGLGGIYSANANGGGFSSGDVVIQARAGVNSRSVLFYTGNTSTERMRIDDSGNVGIGTTTPNSAGLGANGQTLQLSTRTFIAADSSGDTRLGGLSGSNLTAFYQGGTERMQINSGGAALVGTTSASNTTGTGVKLFPEGYGGASTAVGVVGASSTGTNSGFRMYSTGASAYRFYVDYAGTIFATSTSISAISDASLKENVRDLDKGLDTINALQPRRFDWKNGDGNDIMGFIAQEVEEVMPELVHEYKYNDEETKKGLKMGDMVPSMVKAIQELSAQVNELKAEVAALKGA